MGTLQQEIALRTGLVIDHCCRKAARIRPGFGHELAKIAYERACRAAADGGTALLEGRYDDARAALERVPGELRTVDWYTLAALCRPAHGDSTPTLRPVSV